MKATLGAWFNYLLFRLLPPDLYLRTQGIKWHSVMTTVTVTYRLLDGAEKSANVECDATGLVKLALPMWLKYGFFEPHSYPERHWIPPRDILKIEWWDPVLEDYFCVC